MNSNEIEWKRTNMKIVLQAYKLTFNWNCWTRNMLSGSQSSGFYFAHSVLFIHLVSYAMLFMPYIGRDRVSNLITFYINFRFVTKLKSKMYWTIAGSALHAACCWGWTNYARKEKGQSGVDQKKNKPTIIK